EPMLQTPRRRFVRRPRRSVTSLETGSVCQTLRMILNGLFALCERDVRTIVRQMKEPARSPHRKRVRCVQAEEINARLTLVANVHTHVHLGEGGDPRQVW